MFTFYLLGYIDINKYNKYGRYNKKYNFIKLTIMSNKNYEAQWSSAHPGLLVILLDQSGSMLSPMNGVNETRTVYATKAVNRVINSIINKNFYKDKPKNRAFISVIGYNHDVNDIASDYIQNLAKNPKRIDTIKKKVPDDAGGLVETTEEMPIWVDPIDKDGATNMKGAFELAKDIVNKWLSQNTDVLAPAPVIVNVSDGVPYYEGKDPSICMNETEQVVEEIKKISNADGNVLIFNACIGDGSRSVFPTKEEELSDEEGNFYLGYQV